MRRRHLLLPSFRIGGILVIVGLIAVVAAALTSHETLARIGLWATSFGVFVMVAGWIASGLRLRRLERRSDQAETA
jgi:hypothetical protein